MKYKYKDVRRALRKLKDTIMEEYDNSPNYSVRVNLMPKAHNAMSEWEKVDNWGNLTKEQISEARSRGIMHPVGDEFYKYVTELGLDKEDFTESIKVLHNSHNAHKDPTTIAIHEMTPGPERFKPEGIKTIGSEIATKPKHHFAEELYADGVTEEERSRLFKENRGVNHYDKLARNAGYNQGHGRTILYHAGIYDKGLMDRPEIEILMPATASPDQVSNSSVTPYVYGIERCVNENQNFHLAIANQAMLSAFVLREMGYDDKKLAAMYHVLPHNALAKNHGACPARTMDASILVEESKRRAISKKEMDTILEYVPWSVFQALVMEFFERNEFPEELERKFIYDMSDYDAYMQNPEQYDYRARKLQKPARPALTSIDVIPQDERIEVPMKVDKNNIVGNEPTTMRAQVDRASVERAMHNEGKVDRER